MAGSSDELYEEDARELTPLLALLCQWGKEEAVCVSLAWSISKCFEGRGETAAEGSSGSSSGSSGRKRKSKDDASSNTLIPSLSPSAALVILKNIMGGQDASSKAARSKILVNDSCCAVLESR